MRTRQEDENMLRDINKYHAFGNGRTGGGGAPLKDEDGRINASR
jgi:hypothetical protein